MRTTLLALAIVISGMSGNLQASHRPRPAVHKAAIHKVRRGESAARIARDSGLSVKELEALNPKVNLTRLAVGTPLRVAEEKRAALPLKPAVLPLKPAAPAPALARVHSPSAAHPVAPLPGTPALGPASLVHLERILPAEGLAPAPAGKGNPNRSFAEPGSVAMPSLAGMRQVLPKAPIQALPEEDEPDEVIQVPSATADSTEFTPADRSNLDLLWPVETRTISSAWGPRVRTRVVQIKTRRRSRRVTRRFMGSHKGVDLSAPMGTDIFAAMDGQVVASGHQKEYGNFVAVDHGSGVVTLYAHCNRNFVEVGEIVRRGQKIAEVGRTGNATGPHLHFELRLGGVPQNPLPKMNDMEEIPADMMAQNQVAIPPASSR
ncbi:MAG: LysM peptidoglycan-binding domain-containing M23 family metallopeptidase [Holophaga sp.]|nr:LysM peptidoglycan-binding domain-containing M23 family metallopeptidase [Holophaga sp.]